VNQSLVYELAELVFIASECVVRNNGVVIVQETHIQGSKFECGSNYLA
jgi:hypothetical protein